MTQIWPLDDFHVPPGLPAIQDREMKGMGRSDRMVRIEQRVDMAVRVNLSPGEQS